MFYSEVFASTDLRKSFSPPRRSSKLLFWKSSNSITSSPALVQSAGSILTTLAHRSSHGSFMFLLLSRCCLGSGLVSLRGLWVNIQHNDVSDNYFQIVKTGRKCQLLKCEYAALYVRPSTRLRLLWLQTIYGNLNLSNSQLAMLVCM